MDPRNRKRIGCLAVIAAVIIIPLLYIVLGPGIPGSERGHGDLPEKVLKLTIL